MRKIKKCITVLTAAVLMLANIPYITGFAASGGMSYQYTDADKENFKFSYNFYKTIGVITEDLNIDSTIPRGLWAETVIRFFGLESAIGKSADVHFFADYDPKYEKIGFVNLAADLGLMQAYDDGKFCPDVDVTYEDVCISVVKGLGYEFLAKRRGGGVEQYMLIASELGITKGVTAARGYPMVASAAMELLDNALDADMLGVDLGIRGSYETGGTVLSKVHKMQVRNGIVTSNFRSSLYNSDKTHTYQVGINGDIYDYYGNTDGLVGYRVRYYVKTDEEDTVVYLGKLKNTVEVIDFADIYEYENRTYHYAVSNDTRERKWEIPRDCAVMYNGTALTDGFDIPMYTDNGSLTLIDNDNDSDVDVLLIEAYTDLWIGHIDIPSQTVYSKYSDKDYISFDDYNAVELYDEYGAETTINKLAVKNVLSIAPNTDKETIQIDVSTSTVEGTVSGTRKDRGKTVFTIDDIEYTVSVMCDVSGLQAGFSGIFYLNKQKRIVGFEQKVSVPVGYLIRAGLDSEDDGKIYLRILKSNGETELYKCADKVRLWGDGGSYRRDELYRILLDGNEKVKSQPILYELNGSGDVCSLDLVGYSDRIREWTSIKSASVKYRSSASCFTDGKTFLNVNPTIFAVSKSGDDLSDYSVLNKSDLQDDREYASDTLPAYSYQLGDSKLGADVLVVDESFRSRKYGMGIVKSIVQTMDEYDDRCYKIEIYQYGNLNTYYMYNEDFDIESINAASSAFPARKLEEGDVVGIDYLNVGGRKKLSRITIIYDISQDKYLYSNPSTTAFTGETRYFFGDVQTKDSRLMTVVLRGGTMMVDEETAVDKNTGPAANRETHVAGGNVYRYDRKQNEVVKSNINEIAAYETVGDKYSTIWMFTSKESPQMIYIVN